MSDPKKKTLGRPTSFTAEIGREICFRIADGESLRSICRDDHIADRKTVLRWLVTMDPNKHPDLVSFRHQYALAREAQAETFLDEILFIADDSTNDWTTKIGRGGDEITVLDHEHVQRSRLRVDARKWAMSKMAPKKYGDRQALEHSGPDGGPVVVGAMVNKPQPQSKEEWIESVQAAGRGLIEDNSDD